MQPVGHRAGDSRQKRRSAGVELPRQAVRPTDLVHLPPLPANWRRRRRCRQRHAALHEALTHLPPRCKLLIALLTADPPVPYAQISATLGIPIGSIGPTRSRCLTELRRYPAIAALINAEAASTESETLARPEASAHAPRQRQACAPPTSPSRPTPTSSSPRMVAARSSSPRPARALAPPGPAPAPRSSRAASSTAPTGRPASSPSRPSWSACSAVISAITAPRPDGRLFRGARGGMLSESVYGRAWHAARLAALGPGLAATPLARHPYDLRHAALSLWLNATGEPAEVAARAGEQRPRPLRGLPALHRRPARYRQPADRRRPRRRHAWLSSASRRGNERLCEPSAPPRTLSAICT